MVTMLSLYVQRWEKPLLMPPLDDPRFLTTDVDTSSWANFIQHRQLAGAERLYVWCVNKHGILAWTDFDCSANTLAHLLEHGKLTAGGHLIALEPPGYAAAGPSNTAGARPQTKARINCSHMILEWELLHCLHRAPSNSWKHAKFTGSGDDIGQVFTAWLNDHGESLRGLAVESQLKTEACCAEPDNEDSKAYATGQELLKQVATLVVKELGLDAGENALHAHSLKTPTCTVAGAPIIPDVVMAITSANVQSVDEGNALAVMDTLHEFRTRQVFGPRTRAVKTGLTQVLSNVHHGLMQRGGSFLRLGGCVTDGTRLISVVVDAHSSQQNNEAVITQPLQLAGDELPSTDGTGQRELYQVSVEEGGGYDEILFHIWLALRARLPTVLQAAAGVQELQFQPNDELTIEVTSASTTDGGGDEVAAYTDQENTIRVRVSGLKFGLLAGNILSGPRALLNASVLLKMGFSAEQRSLAMSLQYPWTTVFQVEREQAARSQLTKPVRNLAPLIAAGKVVATYLQHHDDASITGRSVLMFADVAEPVCPDGVLQQLQHDTLMTQAPSLVAAVIDLNKQGVLHNDITPSNVLQFQSPLYGQVLGLCDLGAASANSVELLVDSVVPAKYRPILSTARHSPIADPRYGSMEALQRLPLGPSSDLQSLVFTLMSLDGIDLPWESAAAAGDFRLVVEMRKAISQADDPAAALGVSNWPLSLQQLACAAVKCQESAAELAATIAQNVPVCTVRK